jgi:hypothetical protein
MESASGGQSKDFLAGLEAIRIDSYILPISQLLCRQTPALVPRSRG